MAAAWVVPAFDKVEESEARVGLGAEAFAIEQLALEGREEALTHGVVVGVAHTAHRRADAGVTTAPSEGERRVLGEFKRLSQHLIRGGCDDQTEAAFGAGRTSQTTLARPPLGAAA
jgi:hypothetical protein